MKSFVENFVYIFVLFCTSIAYIKARVEEQIARETNISNTTKKIKSERRSSRVRCVVRIAKAIFFALMCEREF